MTDYDAIVMVQATTDLSVRPISLGQNTQFWSLMRGQCLAGVPARASSLKTTAFRIALNGSPSLIKRSYRTCNLVVRAWC